MNDKLSRVIDANCNRTREGLRVLEEIGRFWLDDKNVFNEIKKTRHDFSKIESEIKISSKNIIASRDSINDVGKQYIQNLEGKRDNISSLVTANAKRVEESLRVLEEFLKLIDKNNITQQIKQIRFKTYTLEKQIHDELKK